MDFLGTSGLEKPQDSEFYRLPYCRPHISRLDLADRNFQPGVTNRHRQKSSKKSLFLPAKESGKCRPNRKTSTHSHRGFSRTEWGNWSSILFSHSETGSPTGHLQQGFIWSWASTPSKQQEDLRKWWEKGKCGVLRGEVWVPLCFTAPRIIQVNRAQWEAEPPHPCGCNETEWIREKKG